MKKLLLVLIFVILISSVSAIRINEVEMNPIDDCYDCTEWAELYSETEINLSEYWLENSKSQIINLSGIGEGYIKIDFGKRFLTNSGDKLVLKKDGQVIDETPTLEDGQNDNKTWQLCGSWEFLEATKGKENKCEEEENPEESGEGESEEEEPPEQENDEEEEEDTKEIIKVVGRTSKNPENQSNEEEIKPIILNPQSIKTETNSGEVSKNYAVYSFIAFSVLLALLFLMKRRKYENEFT